jgi:hypothetical protein
MERELGTHAWRAERDVVRVEHLEDSAAFASGTNGLASAVEHTLDVSEIIDSGKSLDVLLVGRETDFRIPVQNGDTLAHRKPTGTRSPVGDFWTPDQELAAIIDRRLVAQYASEFVIHFDAVTFDPMFDSGALPPFPEIGADLARKGAVNFAAKESHDILGPQCRWRSASANLSTAH